jgi:hypothetical protein
LTPISQIEFSTIKIGEKNNHPMLKSLGLFATDVADVKGDIQHLKGNNQQHLKGDIKAAVPVTTLGVTTPGMSQIPTTIPSPLRMMMDTHQKMLRGMARSGKNAKVGRSKGKMPRFTAWVTQQVVNTSASTTAQAPVNTLNLGTSASIVELSSFTVLFDVARCIDLKVQVSVQVPGSNTSPIECGVSFDPANAGAYGSANATQLATQHKYWVIPGSSDAVLSQTKNGLQTLRIKIPNSPNTTSAPGTSLVGGGWFALTDSNAFVGFIKSYINASTASTTIQTLNIFYKVEFKSRS